jgi:hypothetical protein
MPTDDRVARINQAIDNILEHCTQHGQGSLKQCLDGLARNSVWAPEEIEVVRRVVTARLDESKSD